MYVEVLFGKERQLRSDLGASVWRLYVKCTVELSLCWGRRKKEKKV